jgi:MYXO-CTERM domain-containing protein
MQSEETNGGKRVVLRCEGTLRLLDATQVVCDRAAAALSTKQQWPGGGSVKMPGAWRWLAAVAVLLKCSSPAQEDAPAQANAASQAPTDDWQQRVRLRISDSEYRIRRGGDGWEAGNRAQGLRARWGDDGVSVQPRTEDGPTVQLTLTSWGRQSLEPVAPAPFEEGGPRADGAVDVDGTPLLRLMASHGPVTEWWENRAEGLEQGFTIARAPAGDGPLRLVLSVTGARVTGEAADAVTLEGAGGQRLRYAGMKAWDAAKRPLRAWLEARGAQVQLVVDDAQASYPLQVDPLLTAAAWTAEPNQASAVFGSFFGSSVASAGDVNGDGFGDVIVGAYTFDNGETDEGRAFVYLGSASGLTTAAAWTAESNQADAQFGRSVASAGDVNGDGFGDVIVGANAFDNGEPSEGRAFVYLGSASGLATATAWTAESNQADAQFGQSVASAGDVNGDGFGDVIVGAWRFSNGELNEGRAFVYLGSASGLATAAAWTAESNKAGASFGRSVASAGDVNGDGYGDVIVGADTFDNGEPSEGRAFVYLGAASGLATATAWTAESNQAFTYFGHSVASAGDVNGDGFGDVIVGAYFFDNGQTGEGRAFVYLGSASGLSMAAAWTAESNQAFAYFGFSVASAGDVNGDGYGDVIVGASFFSDGETEEGRAFVYLGSASGLSTAAAWTAESNQANAHFGQSVASAGDVNGDGFGDVIVEARLFDNGETDEGRAFVYLGAASGLSTAAAWTAESNQTSALFGWSVASAGDVNGDGFGDVIVGAPGFDNGEVNEGRAFVYLGSASGLSTAAPWAAESNQTSALFGYSVASAGDVNGDGYGDVIVGASFFSDGETNEGRAFVYLGSASGLSTAAAWTAESNQANAFFGWPVASAGDVNGDGYGDVIVGAQNFDNGETDEGRAFVYLGSDTGLATAAAWTAESNQAGAAFGISVASAGDVNGDGFGDVIVGAWLFDNGETDEGRAFVYLGAASGLSTPAAWTAESNQPSASFGQSAASAGDVNGDGYGDVIVGARSFDNGETNEGQAFVYVGSASGLSLAAAWTAESNQVAADFGISVASAGDVNGDGFGDVIVGASNFSNGQGSEGRAFVYVGSAAETSPTSVSRLAVPSGYSGNPTSFINRGGVTRLPDPAIGAVSQTEAQACGNVATGSVIESADSILCAGSFGSNGTCSLEVLGAVQVSSQCGATEQNLPCRVCRYQPRTFSWQRPALSTAAAWTAESDQSGASFGTSVAPAGDVNGDGYGDVIVGAHVFASGQTDEGRAFVYLGNGQDGTQGVALAPQARQRSVVTPVAPGGLLRASPTAFDVGLLTARLPVGRARVRLQGEVKPLGVPFNGLGLIRSPGWVDTGTTGALAQLTFSSLAPGTGYHWRARLLADPSQGASTAASRWLVGGLSGQPNAVHVRTPGVDAGVGPDAGADAGLDAGVDAGASADAGLDAGVDAGASADAGLDAGVDAGAGADAGMDVDAGSDAGVSADAGADVDAGVDGGQQRLSLRVGCGCSPDASAPGVWWMVAIGLLALARRRTPPRIALASVDVLKALGSPDAHSK